MMAGIPSVGATTAALRFQAEYSGRVAKLQLDAVEQQGDLALQLIQSASVDTGQNLNITV
ncbi:MAG: hypothetical protein GC168_09685 [Candidatus Hydrogenedens sp.]|nr:hypothetical protein [Candidatus Hydrogenedens sp.]